MEREAHLSALESDGHRLADAVTRSGLDAPIPTCPGWNTRDLVRHLGYVHRWAGTHVAQASPTELVGHSEAEVLAQGPEDGALLEWFLDGHAELVTTLRTADPDLVCWTFMGTESSLDFWCRRQAHETAVHRVDAERASGPAGPIAVAFAADGVDELIMSFTPREKTPMHSSAPRTLGVHATDTGHRWRVSVSEGRAEAERGSSEGDCVITGSAPELYLLLWNRLDRGPSVNGDPAVLDLWRSEMRVRW
ncbi:MAG: maleylpyruvate isomerase family mycothiol-dependent enzyme [Acidimicrobiales bacterium]